jgi:hypothetical protein
MPIYNGRFVNAFSNTVKNTLSKRRELNGSCNPGTNLELIILELIIEGIPLISSLFPNITYFWHPLYHIYNLM